MSVSRASRIASERARARRGVESRGAAPRIVNEIRPRWRCARPYLEAAAVLLHLHRDWRRGNRRTSFGDPERRDVFTQEARGLIAADATISTRREWTPAARRRSSITLRWPEPRPGPKPSRRRRWFEPSRPRAAPPQPGPFGWSSSGRWRNSRYGTIGLEGGQHAPFAPGEPRCARRPELLTALGVKVGDHPQSRRSRFAASSPPSQGAAWALQPGPRVLIDLADVGRPACQLAARCGG